MGRLAIIQYICSYGEKSKSYIWREVVSISSYELLTIILGIALLIVEIIGIIRRK